MDSCSSYTTKVSTANGEMQRMCCETDRILSSKIARRQLRQAVGYLQTSGYWHSTQAGSPSSARSLVTRQTSVKRTTAPLEKAACFNSWIRRRCKKTRARPSGSGTLTQTRTGVPPGASDKVASAKMMSLKSILCSFDRDTNGYTVSHKATFLRNQLHFLRDQRHFYTFLQDYLHFYWISYIFTGLATLN